MSLYLLPFVALVACVAAIELDPAMLELDETCEENSECGLSLRQLRGVKATLGTDLSTLESEAADSTKGRNYCCFDFGLVDDICGSCYANAQAVEGASYHNSTYCTTDANSCDDCGGTWCEGKAEAPSTTAARTTVTTTEEEEEETTAAPATTKAPVTTRAPATTKAPSTTAAPTTVATTEEEEEETTVATTVAPATTKAPATTAAPATTKAPVVATTAAPVVATTAAPVATTAAPVATTKATTAAPVTTTAEETTEETSTEPMTTTTVAKKTTAATTTKAKSQTKRYQPASPYPKPPAPFWHPSMLAAKKALKMEGKTKAVAQSAKSTRTDFCCFSGSSKDDICGSCYDNAVAPRGEVYHNTDYCTQSATSCSDCGGTWCGARVEKETGNVLMEKEATQSDSCTADDAAAISQYGSSSFPKAAADCGQNSWSLWSGFNTGSFSSCLASETKISSSCASCFAGNGKFSYDNCKMQCLFGSWCSTGCLSCSNRYSSTLSTCVGSQIVLPQAEPC